MATEIPEIVRTISGKGVITIPENFVEALQIYLYVQVLRESQSVSRNLTWNPDRSFYAHVTFCIDNFVLWEYDVNFDKQVFLVHDGQASQNLLSLICAYDGVLDSFVQVGQILGTVLSRTNLITNHPYLRFQPNRIRFECFGSTALVLTLKGTFLEKCRPEDGSPVPPPPPPPPVPFVPPGTPVEVSPPEDGLDDGGDTIPFPIDEPPDPGIDFPFGEECVLYNVTAVVSSINLENSPRTITLPVFGIISGARIDPPAPNTQSFTYGVVGKINPGSGQPCVEDFLYPFVLVSDGDGSIEITDIVEA